MSLAIDALVAENVFGWHRDETAARCEAWIWRDKEGLGLKYIHSWHPSTDPIDSKMLRWKMRHLGWNYRITVQIIGRVDATFQRGTHSENWGYAEHESDTEEMAVALAALAAFGIEAPTE